MNKYIQLLHDQLTSQPMKFYDWNAESILEFLFCCYIEDHPLDNDAIRRCYEKIEPFFESLPRNASNELFQDIAAVCIAYEQAAFIEGVRVGVVLQEELTDLDKKKLLDAIPPWKTNQKVWKFFCKYEMNQTMGGNSSISIVIRLKQEAI